MGRSRSASSTHRHRALTASRGHCSQARPNPVGFVNVLMEVIQLQSGSRQACNDGAKNVGSAKPGKSKIEI